MSVKLSSWSVFLLFSVGISLFGFRTAFGQNSQTPKTLLIGVLNEKAKELVMPKLTNFQPRIAGSLYVQVKIDLQKGEVISATAVSGHPLLRFSAENAAKKAKFEPILKDFETIYGTGVLVYKVEDFTGKIIENKNPKPILPIIEFRTAIINGKAIKLEKPEYSDEARNNCAAGKVEVLTLIHSGSGEVFAAKAISGNELLFDSSEKAVMQSKFAPSNINGNNDFYVVSKIVYNFDSLAKCISVGIVNKKALNIPKPQVGQIIHPKHLRILKEQIVAVQIVVDESGKVTQAKAISGHPLLYAACTNSARQTKFPPTLIDGPPIKVKALFIYKFKPDGTIDTDIETDDKTVIGTPINLVEPPPPFCNCRGLGGSVLVQAKIDERGNVIEANAFSGHPVLRFPSEKAALESKFLPTNTKAKILISYNFDSSDGGRTAKIKNVEIKEVKIEK